MLAVQAIERIGRKVGYRACLLLAQNDTVGHRITIVVAAHFSLVRVHAASSAIAPAYRHLDFDARKKQSSILANMLD